MPVKQATPIPPPFELPVLNAKMFETNGKIVINRDTIEAAPAWKFELWGDTISFYTKRKEMTCFVYEDISEWQSTVVWKKEE